MNLWRAILYGALSWVLIFFEVSILMFGLNLTGVTYYTIHYILAAIIIAVTATLYFSKKGTKAGLLSGLKVGIIFVAAGIILDVIITVPLFTHTYTFFLDPLLILGFLEGIAVVMVIGALKK